MRKKFLYFCALLFVLYSNSLYAQTLNTALEKYCQGNLEEAFTDFQIALTREEEEPKAKELARECFANCTIGLGNKYLQTGDYQKALNYLEKAINLLPKNAEIRNLYQTVTIELGNKYLQTGDYQKALNYLEKAKKYAPENKEIDELYSLTKRARQIASLTEKTKSISVDELPGLTFKNFMVGIPQDSTDYYLYGEIISSTGTLAFDNSEFQITKFFLRDKTGDCLGIVDTLKSEDLLILFEKLDIPADSIERITRCSIEMGSIYFPQYNQFQLLKPSSNDGLTFEDELLQIQFIIDSNLNRIKLSLENKTESLIKIDWQKTFYIDSSKITHQIVPLSTRVIDLNKDIPDTFVPPHSKMEEDIYPLDFIKVNLISGLTLESPMEQGNYFLTVDTYRRTFETENHSPTTFRIYLTLEVGDVFKTYDFAFSANDNSKVIKELRKNKFVRKQK